MTEVTPAAYHHPTEPSEFRPRFWIRGGHLQTIVSMRSAGTLAGPTSVHLVDVDTVDDVLRLSRQRKELNINGKLATLLSNLEDMLMEAHS